ncbi:hypothetical protein [Mycobacterium sp. CnD-18-1]|uniref:hypothetical protein n=1 Tax=Mycobacterium sp. CnD-18-1 TaxID=2917744 RepID=UPI001EF3766B|nr:hypothetical protein [Mycobacterium sp. CnD-18-1]MCG7607157.1 hypothetical protein [Mycobacterium sp. CnD-18-1]
MSGYFFNRSLATVHPTRFTPRRKLIEGTPNLRRASLQNALLFGGPLVRQCLAIAPIVGDHRHVFVDTKVSMLMPGWWPAIPGWHTDGVPRIDADGINPLGIGRPSLPEQLDQHEDGYAPRYHTIHVGNDCPTEFIDESVQLFMEHDRDEQMYAEMTRKIDSLVDLRKLKAPEGRWVSWDWWNIHRATQATERGWRLLIRITESDQPPAEQDFIRPQNQVYVSQEFGW